MAKMVTMVDDLDPRLDAEYVDLNITYDGVQYSLDLSEQNKAALDSALAPFLDRARKVGGKKASKRSAGAAMKKAGSDTLDDLTSRQPVPRKGTEWWLTPAGADNATSNNYKAMRKQVREWGRQNGWPDLSDRGRIPDEVYNSWAAHEYK